jgi:hydrogenase maturation protease
VTSNGPKTLILGLGNILMGDEGIGVHVARALEQRELPADVECMDGGTGGLVLLEPMQNAARVIMIDAANDGNEVGTITRTTPRFSKDYPPTLTAHDIGIKDLLDIFYVMGGSCDVVLYAVTVDAKQPISLSLSEMGSRAAAKVTAQILAELGEQQTSVA